MLSLKQTKEGHYYIQLDGKTIHTGLTKDEATSFMHTYHKIWEAGQESGRMDTELGSSEFCVEEMPIIEIDISGCKEYKREDYDIDLLSVCGTFDTNDCISVEDLIKLLEKGETK